MSTYTAPLRDMLFTMKEVGGLEAICAQPGHEDAVVVVIVGRDFAVAFVPGSPAIVTASA